MIIRLLTVKFQVRLANIMKEINLLPKELLGMPSCRLVQDWYQQSFRDFMAYENKPAESPIMSTFTETISNVLKRHNNVVETMAEGLMEMRQTHGVDVANQRHIQYFLDRFYLNRISIRMLMNQHREFHALRQNVGFQCCSSARRCPTARGTWARSTRSAMSWRL